LNYSVYGIYALAYNIDPIVEIFRKDDGGYEELENKVDFFVKSDATKQFNSKNPYHLIQEFMINQFWLLNEDLKDGEITFEDRGKMTASSHYITKAICKLKPLKYYLANDDANGKKAMFKSASKITKPDIKMSSNDFINLVRKNNDLLKHNKLYKDDYYKWQCLFIKPDGSDFINFIDAFEPENGKDLMPKSFLKYLVEMIRPGFLIMDKNEIKNFLKKIESKFGKLDFVKDMDDKSILLGLLASFKKIDKELLGQFSFNKESGLKINHDNVDMFFKDQKFDSDVIAGGYIKFEFAKNNDNEDPDHVERFDQIKSFVEKYISNSDILLSNPLSLKELFDDEKLFVCTFRGSADEGLFERSKSLGVDNEKFNEAHSELKSVLGESDDVFYEKYEAAKKILDEAITTAKEENKTNSGEIKPNENNLDQNKKENEKTKQEAIDSTLNPLKDNGAEILIALHDQLLTDIEKINLTQEPYNYRIEAGRVIVKAHNGEALYETLKKLELYGKMYRSVVKFINEANEIDKDMNELNYKKLLLDIEKKLELLVDVVNFIRENTKSYDYLRGLEDNFIESIEKVSDGESLSLAGYKQKLDDIKSEFENTVKNKKVQKDILDLVTAVITSTSENGVKEIADNVRKQIENMKIDGSNDVNKKLLEIKNKFGKDLENNKEAKKKFDDQSKIIGENNTKKDELKQRQLTVKKRVKEFNEAIAKMTGKPEDRVELNMTENEKQLKDFYKHVDELEKQNKNRAAGDTKIFNDLKNAAASVQKQMHPEAYKAMLDLKENIYLKRFIEKAEKNDALNRANTVLLLENSTEKNDAFSNAVKEIKEVSEDENKSIKDVKAAIRNILVGYGEKHENAEVKKRIGEWIKTEEAKEKEKAEKEKNEKNDKLQKVKNYIDGLKEQYSDYGEILNLINDRISELSEIDFSLSIELYALELNIIIINLKNDIFELKEKIEKNKKNEIVLNSLSSEIDKLEQNEKCKNSKNFKNAINRARNEIDDLRKKNYSNVDLEVYLIRENLIDVINKENRFVSNHVEEPKESDKTINLKAFYEFKKSLSDDIKEKFASELIRLEYSYDLLEKPTDNYLKEIEYFTNIVVNTKSYEEFIKDIRIIENDLDYEISSDARQLRSKYKNDFSDLEKSDTKKLPKDDYDKKLNSLKSKIDDPLNELKKKKADKDRLEKFVTEKQAALSGTDYYDFFYYSGDGHKHVEELKNLAGKSEFDNKFKELEELCNKVVESSKKKKADKDKLEKFVAEKRRSFWEADYYDTDYYNFFYHSGEGGKSVEELKKLAGTTDFDKKFKELKNRCDEVLENLKKRKADIAKLNEFVEKTKKAFDSTEYNDFFYYSGEGEKYVKELEKLAGTTDFDKKFKELEGICNKILGDLGKKPDNIGGSTTEYDNNADNTSELARLVANNIEDPAEKELALKIMTDKDKAAEYLKREDVKNQLKKLKKHLEKTVLNLDDDEKKKLAAKLLGVDLESLDNLMKPENRQELIKKSFEAAEKLKKSVTGFSFGAGGAGALALIAVVLVSLSATGFLAVPLIPIAIVGGVCGFSAIGLGTKAGIDNSNRKSLDTRVISPAKQAFTDYGGKIFKKIPKEKIEKPGRDGKRL